MCMCFLFWFPCKCEFYDQFLNFQVIPSVELNHAGRYSCLGNNEAGSAELMFHIRVSGWKECNAFVLFYVPPELISLRDLSVFI